MLEWTIVLAALALLLAALWAIARVARGRGAGRRVRGGEVAYRVRIAVPMSLATPPAARPVRRGDDPDVDGLIAVLEDLELADRLRLTIPAPDLAVAYLTVVAADRGAAERHALDALARSGLAALAVTATREVRG